MLKLIAVLSLSFLVGCACFNSRTLYGLDGKATSWCERKQQATKLCKNHGGLKEFYFAHALCNNGVHFTDEVEKYD